MKFLPTLHIFTLSILAALSFMQQSTANAAETVNIFNGSLNGWKEKSFVDHTDYTINADGKINAQCNASASSMYREIAIDLDKTPVLNWSWKLPSPGKYNSVNERTKTGDDFAARIYAVVDTGTIIPNVLTLNYVWAGGEENGAHWNNPFYKKAHMVVVNDADQTGQWVSQSRNIKDDFQNYFARDIDTIDGIAIMTDCDNTGGQAAAFYGRIYMSP